MSTVAQRRKTIKPRQRVCTKIKHNEEGAKLHVKKLRMANPITGRTLEAFPCKTCKPRNGEKVYHVGHKRKDHGS
jgi:hypothetical protein